MTKLTSNHFRLFSPWAIEKNGSKFYNGESQYIIDLSTNEKYLNSYLFVIRFKCAALAAGTPIIHGIFALYRLGFHFFRLFSHSYDYITDKNHASETNALAIKQDLGHILFILPSLLLLECAAIFGIICPLNGRKLYANNERAIMQSLGFKSNDGFLAPCFQPKPADEEIHHLFHGDVNSQSAW